MNPAATGAHAPPQILQHLWSCTMKTKRNRSSRKRASKRRKAPQRDSSPIVGIPSARKRLQKRASRARANQRSQAQPSSTPSTTQSGDLTGLSGGAFTAGQNSAELMAEGQDLEGELILGVQQSDDSDEEEVPPPPVPRGHVPDYNNRNRY
jgi:hypothetical protein